MVFALPEGRHDLFICRPNEMPEKQTDHRKYLTGFSVSAPDAGQHMAALKDAGSVFDHSGRDS